MRRNVRQMSIESCGQPERNSRTITSGGRQNNRRRAGRSSSAPVIALAREGQTSGQLDEPARNGGSNECAVWTRRWHHRGWDRAKLLVRGPAAEEKAAITFAGAWMFGRTPYS